VWKKEKKQEQTEAASGKPDSFEAIKEAEKRERERKEKATGNLNIEGPCKQQEKPGERGPNQRPRNPSGQRRLRTRNTGKGKLGGNQGGNSDVNERNPIHSMAAQGPKRHWKFQT